MSNLSKYYYPRFKVARYNFPRPYLIFSICQFSQTKIDVKLISYFFQRNRCFNGSDKLKITKLETFYFNANQRVASIEYQFAEITGDAAGNNECNLLVGFP